MSEIVSDGEFERCLQAGYVLLSQARQQFDQAFRARPAVRVVKVATDEDVLVPAIAVHVCTDECDAGDEVFVERHVFSEGELERAYNSARLRLKGILMMAGKSLRFKLPDYNELTNVDYHG